MKNLASLLLSLFLVSCTTAAKTFPTERGNLLISSTPTVISATPSPILPISTGTPEELQIISLTPTSLPTLPANIANETFQQWLLGSSDCPLPCWGGIVPGETKWSDALHQLRPVFQYGSIPTNGECRFGECHIWGWNYSLGSEKNYDGVLFGKEDTLYAIQINGNYDSVMSLNHIFETYEQPAQVFIGATSEPRGDPPRLSMTFLYPQFKFMVTYMWWASVENEKFSACGEPVLFQLGIVAIDENQWTPVELAANGEQLMKHSSNIWSAQPISKVTNVTTADLYAQVTKSSSDVCVITPVEYWP